MKWISGTDDLLRWVPDEARERWFQLTKFGRDRFGLPESEAAGYVIYLSVGLAIVLLLPHIARGMLGGGLVWLFQPPDPVGLVGALLVCFSAWRMLRGKDDQTVGLKASNAWSSIEVLLLGCLGTGVVGAMLGGLLPRGVALIALAICGLLMAYRVAPVLMYHGTGPFDVGWMVSAALGLLVLAAVLSAGRIFASELDPQKFYSCWGVHPDVRHQCENAVTLRRTLEAKRTVGLVSDAELVAEIAKGPAVYHVPRSEPSFIAEARRMADWLAVPRFYPGAVGKAGAMLGDCWWTTVLLGFFAKGLYLARRSAMTVMRQEMLTIKERPPDGWRLSDLASCFLVAGGVPVGVKVASIGSVLLKVLSMANGDMMTGLFQAGGIFLGLLFVNWVLGETVKKETGTLASLLGGSVCAHSETGLHAAVQGVGGLVIVAQATMLVGSVGCGWYSGALAEWQVGLGLMIVAASVALGSVKAGANGKYVPGMMSLIEVLCAPNAINVVSSFAMFVAPGDVWTMPTLLSLRKLQGDVMD